MDFVENDTGSILRVTCTDRDSGAVINLTGATVRLRWKQSGVVTTKTMDIVSPATAGIAEYQFATGELVRGVRQFEVEITDSGGKKLSSLEPLVKTIRKEFG